MKNVSTKRKILILGVLGFLIVIASIVLLFASKSKDLIDFSALKKDEAVSWIKSKALTKNISIKEEFSDDIKEGYFISQSLPPGTVVDKDSKVELVFSKGYDKDKHIIIPNDIFELSELQIMSFFSDNHIDNYNVEYKLIKDAPPGKLIYISDLVSVKRKKNVNLIFTGDVNDDKFKVKMIDFSKYSLDSVESWVKMNNLELDVSYMDSDKPTGSFVMQSPQVDSLVTPFTTVSVVYSKGDAVYMISVVGLDRSKVESWANKNEIHVIFEEVYSDKPEGYVLSCDRKINAELHKGDKVYMSVSKGEQPSISVPDNLVNISESEFVNKIKALGLNPVKNSSVYNNDIPKGNIISYEANKTYYEGDNVLYNVSLGKEEKPQEEPKNDSEEPSKPEEEVKPQNPETAYITTINMLRYYEGKTAQETVNNLKSGALSPFTNVVYKQTTHDSYTEGIIISITDENGNPLNPGEYPINKQINVLISEGLKSN